jgi:hypothetical protein
MTFSSFEFIALALFCALWWLVYMTIKMRNDQKYKKGDLDPALKPCQGCMITQSAMLSACMMAVGYGLYVMEIISFSN